MNILKKRIFKKSVIFFGKFLLIKEQMFGFVCPGTDFSALKQYKIFLQKILKKFKKILDFFQKIIYNNYERVIICYRKILTKKKEKIAILGLDFLQKLRKIKQNIQEKLNIKIKIFSKKILKKVLTFSEKVV